MMLVTLPTCYLAGFDRVLPPLPLAVVDYAVEASNLAHRILLLRKVLEAGNDGQQ